MKKLCIPFGTILLLFALLTLAATAAGATATAETSHATAFRGEEVVLTVSVSESTTVTSGSVELLYDTNVLQFVSGECNLTDALMGHFDANTQKGVFVYSSPKTVSGTLFTVRFRIRSDAAFGLSAVTLKLSMKDESMNDMTMTNRIGSVTVDCVHAFTAEVVDDRYIIETAGCGGGAIYYKSCVHCGAVGTDTFSVGGALDHLWSSTYETDGISHWRTCTRPGCGVLKTPVPHSGGMASCSERAHCTVCGHAYGDLPSHDYTGGLFGTDADGHWTVCDKCGFADTEHSIPHSGNDDGDCATAVFCVDCHHEMVAANTHALRVTFSNDEETHTLVCMNDGCTYKESQIHAFDMRVVAESFRRSYADCTNEESYYFSCVCNQKGTTKFFTTAPALGHDFAGGEWVTTDQQAHWKQCSRCAVEDIDHKTAHTYARATANGDDTHTGICSCGRVHTEACSGNESLATCQRKATCAVCGEAYGSLGGHMYDMSTWGYKDADGHAHRCQNPGCSAHDTIVAHCSSGAATSTTPEICTACGYVLSPALSHTTHTPASEWSSDGESHWKECTGCAGQKLENAAHTFDNACDTACHICGYERIIEHDYVMTYDENEHYLACSVCGEEKAGSRVAHSGGEASCFKRAECDECKAEYGQLENHHFNSDAWEYADPDGHARVCMNPGCGAHSELESHVVDGDNAEGEPVQCALCGYTLNGEIGHEHKPQGDLQHDSTHHWFVCECGEPLESEEHQFENGVCSVCGRENDKQSETVTQAEPSAAQPSMGMVTVIIIIVAVLVMVGGIVALVLILAKKR